MAYHLIGFSMLNIRTGYENHYLKDIMRVWLYSEDQQKVYLAAIEMRKRLSEMIRREPS